MQISNMYVNTDKEFHDMQLLTVHVRRRLKSYLRSFNEIRRKDGLRFMSLTYG